MASIISGKVFLGLFHFVNELKLTKVAEIYLYLFKYPHYIYIIYIINTI